MNSTVARPSSTPPPPLQSRVGLHRCNRAIAALLGCGVLASCSLSVATPELWRLRLREVPLTSFQLGQLWQAIGTTGLWCWHCLLMVSLFAIAWCSIRRARMRWFSATILILFSLESLAATVQQVDPRLLTYVAYSAVLLLLRNHWNRSRIRTLALLPLLMLVWEYLHFGFPIGVDSFAPCSRSLQPASCLPFGLVSITMLAWRRVPALDVALVATVSGMAFLRIEFLPHLTLTTMIVLPRHFDRGLRRILPRLSEIGCRNSVPRWTLTSLVIVLLWSCAAPRQLVVWRQGIAPWQIAVSAKGTDSSVPLRAVSIVIQEELAGELATDRAWAPYLHWHLGAQVRALDAGRHPLDAPDAEILLVPSSTSTDEESDFQADWIPIYGDEQARIFVRDLPKFQRAIWRAQEGLIEAPPVPLWTPFPAPPVRFT